MLRNNAMKPHVLHRYKHTNKTGKIFVKERIKTIFYNRYSVTDRVFNASILSQLNTVHTVTITLPSTSRSRKRSLSVRFPTQIHVILISPKCPACPLDLIPLSIFHEKYGTKYFYTFQTTFRGVAVRIFRR